MILSPEISESIDIIRGKREGHSTEFHFRYHLLWKFVDKGNIPHFQEASVIDETCRGIKGVSGILRQRFCSNVSRFLPQDIVFPGHHHIKLCFLEIMVNIPS